MTTVLKLPGPALLTGQQRHATPIVSRWLKLDAHALSLAFAGAVILVSLGNIAAAPECISGAGVTTRRAFGYSSLVFHGRVIQITDPHAPAFTQVLTLDVDKVWKGAVTKRQVIYHAVSVESRVFSSSDRLVVFARELSGDDRVLVGLPLAGPPAFGYLSFNCDTGMPVDIDSALPRMPSSKPR